jgi:hypothetical protein
MKARGVPKRIVPLHDVDRPGALGIDHQDRGASRQGDLRPGEEVLRPTADLDPHLAGAIGASRRDGEDTDRADA